MQTIFTQLTRHQMAVLEGFMVNEAHKQLTDCFTPISLSEKLNKVEICFLALPEDIQPSHAFFVYFNHLKDFLSKLIDNKALLQNVNACVYVRYFQQEKNNFLDCLDETLITLHYSATFLKETGNRRADIVSAIIELRKFIILISKKKGV